MAEHARDVSQHWNRQDVDQWYADHQHDRTSTPLSTRARTWHVCPSICQRAFVCVHFDDLPKRDYQRDFKYQKIHLPLRWGRNIVGGFRKGWGNWRRLSSLQQCLPYSEKDPVSSLVQPSAARIHFIQHYRFTIAHTLTHSYTHTHTHHHSCCIVGLRQNEMCVQALWMHVSLRVIASKCVYVFLSRARIWGDTHQTGEEPCISLKGLICICMLI